MEPLTLLAISYEGVNIARALAVLSNELDTKATDPVDLEPIQQSMSRIERLLEVQISQPLISAMQMLKDADSEVEFSLQNAQTLADKALHQFNLAEGSSLDLQNQLLVSTGKACAYRILDMKGAFARAASEAAEILTVIQSDRTQSLGEGYPRLHNAMWPGLVGKGDGRDQERPISLERMLELTANAEVDGARFEGVDCFIFFPHTDPDASEDELKRTADLVAGNGLKVGSLVAPVWPGTVGDSAMGDVEQRAKFLTAVEKTCRIAKIFNEHGVRQYGVIRIDSADNPENWSKDPKGNTRKIAATFREAAKIAADYGERLAAEGEICWAGMHSWKHMLDLLEEVGMPENLGFQADLAHTYLYLLGYNAPEHALVQKGYTEDEFWAAYEKMTDSLRPWTIDFHVAQNDGQVHGSGSHDKTGKHCPADDPNGKLDIVRCSTFWLKDAESRGIKHICWDGCMFPNATLETPRTWNSILETMLGVRQAVS